MTEDALKEITERDVRTVKLTEEQWTKLQSLSRLPTEAREEVQSAVDRYRYMKSRELPAPAVTRKVCRKISDDAQKLATALEEYIRHYSEGDFDDPVEGEFGRQIDDEWSLFRVSNIAEELIALADRFSRTARHIERDPPGPNDKALYFFVRSLDHVLEKFVGKGVNRSAKRGGMLKFVCEACLIASGDENLRGIEFAVKKLVQRKLQK